MPYLASRKQPPAPGEQIAVPTTVLWPEHDPLFPRDWSDRLDEFFSDISIRFIDGAGHFAPLEYPAEFAAAIRAALDRTRGPETARRGDH
jgi:pimeloyl-ACP methyl ester carboxylesterase